MNARIYFQAYLALMVLLLVTFFAARLNLGPLNISIALLIALAKALLVILYFMEARTSPGLIRIAAATGVFWLGILISLTLSDYLSRGWILLPGHWPQ